MGKIVFFLLATFFIASHATPLESSARLRNPNIYYVYNRDHPRNPVQLEPTEEGVISSSIQFRPLTVIVVHGHEANGFSSLNPVVKDAFLANHDVNVIVVDWSIYASQSYSNAVSSSHYVGTSIAEFVKVLVGVNQVSLNRLHLVGFGLGAHVVGFTGRALDGKVARITGLDPVARQWGSNTQRLSEKDAVYVEVIHTDGDGLTANGLGTALGTVDFFANGGGNQPGCLLHSCSHNRAWELFAASMESNHLEGHRCTSNLQVTLNTCRGYKLAMGNNELIKYGSGMFRVNTGRRYPF